MRTPTNRRLQPLLIVDGYNILRSSGRYDIAGVDDFDDSPVNRARENLIADVAAFAQGRYEAVIVFDGGGNEFSEGYPQRIAGISIIFSEANTDADQLIEKLVVKAREAGREVLVVSSDAQLQNTVFRDGVTRMSALGFSREMQDIGEDLDESGENYSKFTVESRIDPDVRDQLRAMLKRRK